MNAASSVTWLFVPGDRPDRFDRAVAAKADEIIIDLEDAVAPAAKFQARQETAQWLSSGGAAWVRLNGRQTPWFDHDAANLADAPGLRGFILPKCEDPDEVMALADVARRRLDVIALIESAGGVVGAQAIAACPATVRLAFGAVDFALDIDASESRNALLAARSFLVLASRAAGKPAPIDSVTTALSPAVAAADALHARELGFGGKLCIHPRQVGPVSAAFRPTEDEVSAARAVLRAARASDGVTTIGGRMIDRPVIERAQRIVEKASSGNPAESNR